MIAFIRQPRLYLDTSVIGGTRDEEFRRPTLELFDLGRRGKFVFLLSDLTFEELNAAEPGLRNELLVPLRGLPLMEVAVTEEVEVLAAAYVAAGALPGSATDDARHVAAATVHRADVLVSWNFKHMVNSWRNRAFSAVNLSRGYPLIEIRNPREVVNYA